MKKMMTAVALLGLSLPVMANAASFQPLGKTGMGGAGVAVTTDAFASYWNPAGLAFYEKSFSAKFNGGVGININSALAENTDRLSKLDFNSLNGLNASSASNSTDALKSASEATQFIGILKDIDSKGGMLTFSPGGALAFQYNNFGLGAFASSEMNIYVNNVDTLNILPANNNTTIPQFASSLGATTGRPATVLFSTSQYASIVSAFGGNNAVVDTLERQLASSNKSGLPTDQLAQALVDLGNSFGGTGASIDNNTTSLAVKGMLLNEVPIAYGYKFDFKKYGQLGVGGAVKVMMGTVYGSIIKIEDAKGSSNIVKKITDTRTDSTAVGVDLGVAWRKELPLIGQFNAGLVGKNLNSPEFDNPTGFAGKTKVEPQVRFGVACDPTTWLTIAADMDMTKNKTLAEGRDSQNIGGGLEAHASWIALRLGAFKNLAETDGKPVLTGGLSLGPQWMRFDIDAAVATATGIYDNKSYPREAKVEFGLSTMF